MKNTIHFTLNKSLNRKSLIGVSTREAISISRLKLHWINGVADLTAGLNISKSRKETNSADSQGYVCACHHQWSGNSCYSWFQRSRDFPAVEKPINWYVSLPYIRCNQKQNITFSYGFTGARKLKPALFLPQEQGICYVSCVTCLLCHMSWQQFCHPSSIRSGLSLSCCFKEISFLRVPSIPNR